MLEHNFVVGFEKRSGLLQITGDHIKGLLTGKKILYHGTNKENVRSILKNGIVPKTESGTGKILSFIDGYKDHVFLSTSKSEAASYANQRSNIINPSSAREKAIKELKRATRISAPVLKLVSGKHFEKLKKMSKDTIRQIHRGDLDLFISKMKTPNKGSILKVEIPKDVYNKIKALKNPVEKEILTPFTEVAIKGKVHPKYIKEI